MIAEAHVTINGSRAAIWAAITNIENASETISGIEKFEVLEKPANGLVGLKWREIRCLAFSAEKPQEIFSGKHIRRTGEDLHVYKIIYSAISGSHPKGWNY